MTYADQVLIIRAQLWADLYRDHRQGHSHEDSEAGANMGVASYGRAMDLEDLDDNDGGVAER